MAINIKYRPLKAFLLAVDTGSFTQASERLGVTQPSFTALIKDLENILGLKLFNRTTRSISLTKAGSELLQRVERPVMDLEEAYRCMSDLASAGHGTVVIGVLPSVALSLIPTALATLRDKHPAIHIRVIEAHNDDLIAMLRSNQIEFAVGVLFASSTEFDFKPLIEDQFDIVCQLDCSITRHEVVTWSDLLPLDLILLSRGSSIRALFDRAVGHGQTAPSGLRYDVTHMTTAVALVKENLGITLLPRLALPSLNLGALTYLPLADGAAQRIVGIIYRRDRHMSPAAEALHRELQNAIMTIESQSD